MKHTSEWTMQTFTGKVFNPFSIVEEDISELDIIHSLANTNRFNGHTVWPYSVLQHSVLVAEAIPDYSYRELSVPKALLQLVALLHDAHEAYVGDVIRPLKFGQSDIQNEYENVVSLIVLKALGVQDVDKLKANFWAVIKTADRRMCATEERDLLCPVGEIKRDNPKPFLDKITPWDKDYTIHRFVAALNTYKEALRND